MEENYFLKKLYQQYLVFLREQKKQLVVKLMMFWEEIKLNLKSNKKKILLIKKLNFKIYNKMD